MSDRLISIFMDDAVKQVARLTYSYIHLPITVPLQHNALISVVGSKMELHFVLGSY